MNENLFILVIVLNSTK